MRLALRIDHHTEHLFLGAEVGCRKSFPQCHYFSPLPLHSRIALPNNSVQVVAEGTGRHGGFQLLFLGDQPYVRFL